jgi:hypothetical protein
MYKIIYSTSDMIEANMIISYLKDSNIEAKMENELVNNLFPNNGMISSINIVVEDVVYDKSLLLIKEIEKLNTTFEKKKISANKRNMMKYIVLFLIIVSGYVLYYNKRILIEYLKNAVYNDSIITYKWDPINSCLNAYWKDNRNKAAQYFDVNNNKVYEKMIIYSRNGDKLMEYDDLNENNIYEKIAVYNQDGSVNFVENIDDRTGLLESRMDYLGNGNTKITKYVHGVLNQ